jgi:hypothetical protein
VVGDSFQFAALVLAGIGLVAVVAVMYGLLPKSGAGRVTRLLVSITERLHGLTKSNRALIWYIFGNQVYFSKIYGSLGGELYQAITGHKR